MTATGQPYPANASSCDRSTVTEEKRIMQAPQFINQLLFGNSTNSLAKGSTLQTHHLNSEGRVEEDIIPGSMGRIRVDGISWNAKCKAPLFLLKGTRVRVSDYQNMMLIVEPI